MPSTTEYCTSHLHPKLMPGERCYGPEERQMILSEDLWACAVCITNNSQTGKQFRLLPLSVERCEICGADRDNNPWSASGNPYIPITHMVCLKMLPPGLRCGHVNQVSNEFCVNRRCDNQFPATTSTKVPIFDTILLIPKDFSRYWFCMLCWTHNPPNTAGCGCYWPESKKRCGGLFDRDGLTAHEVFYIVPSSDYQLSDR